MASTITSSQKINSTDARKSQQAFGFTAPAGTTTLFSTGVMAGLGSDAGALFTPTFSGHLRVEIMCDGANNTAADGIQCQLSYGTGAAPAANAAKTGTQVGASPQQVNSSLAGSVSAVGQITVEWVLDLLVGTQYWFDLMYGAVTGGTATLSQLAVIIEEY